MNRIVFAAALTGMAFSFSAWAAPVAEEGGYDAKAACERYAQEDLIKPEHMADYMNQCLRDLSTDLAPDQDLDPASLDEKLDEPLEPDNPAPKKH